MSLNGSVVLRTVPDSRQVSSVTGGQPGDECIERITSPELAACASVCGRAGTPRALCGAGVQDPVAATLKVPGKTGGREVHLAPAPTTPALRRDALRKLGGEAASV